MANSRSDVAANSLTKPPTLNAIGASHGQKRYRRASVATQAADAANHFYVLFRGVSAFDRILKLDISNTADAGMTDLNVGAYVSGDWTVADQSLVAGTIEDILVDGANRAAATTQPVNIYGTGTNAFTEDKQGLPLWQQLGLSAAPAPGTVYDIAMRSIGNPAGGGTYVAEMEYLAND